LTLTLRQAEAWVVEGGTVDYSVGQVARYASITVRTLHHYHQIGLVSPSCRTSSGYRRYADEDLQRLHQVLFYRELGFPLEEIATILDEPGVDPASHLRRQHELLTRRIGRLQAMVAAVELAMEAQQMGISLSPEERFEVFGDDDPAQYAEEAEQRWGDTPAYQQSQRRTSSYTKEDWLRIRAAAEDLDRRFVAALTGGAAPDSATAMDLAEEHRLAINDTYYECPYPMHRGLADMYLADPRFTQRYEDLAPGMAQYVHDAVHANADRQE
jgi:DNA-binding transcriptional MerR regulator